MLAECGGTMPVETGPITKGGEFLVPPNLTTPCGNNARSPTRGGPTLEEARKTTESPRDVSFYIFFPQNIVHPVARWLTVVARGKVSLGWLMVAS